MKKYFSGYTRVARSIFFGCALLILLLVICFSVFYLVSGYEYLSNWFLSLNNCFYRVPTWTQDFFTPAVKAQGNTLAVAAISACGIIVFYIARRWKKYFKRGDAIPNAQKGENIAWYIPVALFGISAWYWGQGLAKPSADEIFSAVNCAALPSFQTLAYYMLPNNHIYFNFLNSLIAGIIHTDPVQTGRVFSGVAYVTVLCGIFHWFSKRLKSYTWSYVAIVPVGMQFTTWAFSFQARGYEWQLLCGWLCFLSLFRYIDTADRKWLRINMVACIFGFALVPTYLYFFAAQVVFALLYFMIKRKIDLRFWKYQLFSSVGVFIAYLPALCFSGVKALTANDYVKQGSASLAEFLPHWWATARYLLNFTFSFLIHEDHPLTFILLLSPLLLVFSKNRSDRSILLFWIILWSIWAAISIYMQRVPFSRNMIFHFNFTVALAVYTVYRLIERLSDLTGKSKLRNFVKALLFAAPALIISFHFWNWGKINVPYFLYFMDVNQMYTDYNKEIDNIPAGSSVACSEERYCFFYYCQKRNYSATRCPTGREAFYIKAKLEELPTWVAQNYVPYKSWPEGDDIYKHK